MKWLDVLKKLKVDLDSGIYDPLYEYTTAGSYITGLCQDVESELGIWLEPSIQAGCGGIWVYSSDDDRCLAENIDFEDFDENVIDIALDSNSEEEFKLSYRTFLENIIE